MKEGLSNTKDDYCSNGVLKYSKNFRKVENVGNSVIKMIETNYGEVFQVPILMRGNFPVFMIYHIETKILIGVMSGGCRERILKRKKKNPHYLNALVGFNAKHHFQPVSEQLTLVNLIAYNDEQIEPIKIKVRDKIDGIEPERYVTVLYDMDGLTLTGVEMILMTEKLEVAFRENWSDYIEIDYHNSYEVQQELTDSYESLEISVRNDKINNDSIDLEVKKNEKEENK